MLENIIKPPTFETFLPILCVASLLSLFIDPCHGYKPTNNINDDNNNRFSLPPGSDSVSSHTTFVQADPSTFRAVVQRLTGSTDDPSLEKLPVTVPARQTGIKGVFGELGPRKPLFKLLERRQSLRKLEIKLEAASFSCGSGPYSPSAVAAARKKSFMGGRVSEMPLFSPVSPLDLWSQGSPRTPTQRLTLEEEEEKKAIAEQGFYLHASPLSTPRSSEPELLPLFPLHSPRDSASSSSSSPP
ncbi:VQ motif-containing protein 11-like [Macadamia integrifolia]|uniref:VQ motif-containing protein 11-like n=1 Tax=Macadamia integrifolia TaxID=60698 RepID=UPI001C4F340A|nr:VQ motif-containing protein 11-like [Macadamia integrifolia]